MGARSLRPGLRALAALLLISSAWGRRLGEGEASNAAPLNAALTAALSAAADASNAACTLTDAACGGPAWAQASSAVALLLLSNPTSARFCTGNACWVLNVFLHPPAACGCSHSSPTQPSAGALLSTPHLDGNFVLTANHCRGTDSAASLASRAAVVFGRRRPTCPGGSSAAPSPRRLQEQGQPPPLVLRGLSVAWADEATDVLLLRLTTAQIPPGERARGWRLAGSLPLVALGTSTHRPWPSCHHTPLANLPQSGASAAWGGMPAAGRLPPRAQPPSHTPAATGPSCLSAAPAACA